MAEKAPGAVIERIEAGSIADEAGLEPGDEIVSINGSPVNDLIDYRYLCAETFVEVEVRKPDGDEWMIEIEKEYDEELGVGFTTETFDGLRRCQNRCVFCFLDQMPVGMRHSLYVRDDDYRMSFLHGNFVTLTNLRQEEIERIIAMRISPLYVSVHATDPEARQRLLRNKRAGEVVPLLKRLTEAGIEVHCQVVVCPGFNDGPALDRTIVDLADLWPRTLSLAVVPVGLTRYRGGLPDVEPVSPDLAAATIDQLTGWQERLAEREVTDFLYIADEFYQRAGRELPPYEDYGNFPQLENGVGLVRLFEEEFNVASTRFPAAVETRTIRIVTGVSAGPTIARLAQRLEDVSGLKAEVTVVENRFFGASVTVTGLLTGQDILAALKGLPPVDEVLVPGVALRYEGDRFLDDLTPERLAREIGQRVTVVPVNGEAFAAAALGEDLA